jgi:uncharacterized protein YacL (UPF0231 family)
LPESYHMYRDEDGYPRADFTPPQDGARHYLIGIFLSTDVGSDVDSVTQLIETTEAVVQGQQTSFDGTGNLFTVAITPGQVRIENAYDEDEVVETRPKFFLEVLSDWKNLIAPFH